MLEKSGNHEIAMNMNIVVEKHTLAKPNFVYTMTTKNEDSKIMRMSSVTYTLKSIK